jgi:hypothetical protein
MVSVASCIVSADIDGPGCGDQHNICWRQCRAWASFVSPLFLLRQRTIEHPTDGLGAAEPEDDPASAEAAVSGADGVAVFEALHRRRAVPDAILHAFDLLELNGKDLRPLPLGECKARSTFALNILEKIPAGKFRGLLPAREVL